MRHLNTIAVLTALSAAARGGHLAIECEPGTDLSGIADVLPAESIAAATATGLAIVGFDAFVSGALAYCDVERRMALVPGASVTLVQEDGSVRTRSVPAANVVAVDFSVPAAAPALPRAA